MRQTQAELRLVFGVVRPVTAYSTVWAHNSSKRHGCGQSQMAGGDISGQADVITIGSGSLSISQPGNGVQQLWLSKSR